MKVVALISGGKDSCYNMMHCVAAGHQIVALANLRPAENKEGIDELDSYMYQTVGHHAIELYAEAMGLPLYRHTITGTGVATGKTYTRCKDDEVEDLYQLLKLIKDKENVEAVSVGAILSDYQRVRVEDVCKRLALQPLAYLWRQNQETLFREMISSDIQAIIIKVAALGLDPVKHLGKTLCEMEPYLLELSKKYGVHICGEGGEYETFTLDCPLFKKKIVVDSSEVVVHSADAFAPVAYLRLLKLHLEDKVQYCGEILPGSCSCGRTSFEDNTWPPSNEEKETPCITWYTARPAFVTSNKTFEHSGKSLKGYQWIADISAHFHPSENRSVQESAKDVFLSLQSYLNSEGLELTDIILVHLYVKSMKDFAVINSVYMTVFDLCPPARVCVEVPLPEGLWFQMDCLVHNHDRTISDQPCNQKQVMHVQSISHWAPANIGPYSQCIQVGDILYCAGQIALVPCTMQLISGGVETEALISLRHVEKVLKAMHAELQHVLMANCYVTDSKYISVAQAVWKTKLRELKRAEDEDMSNAVPAACGELAVIVVPFLPRAASIEWHVIAVLDEQQQKQKFVLMRSLENCQIKCEAVQSHPTRTTAVNISVTITSPSTSAISLDTVLCNMVEMFKQTVEKMSGDGDITPLAFRTFYQKNSFEIEALKTGLQRHLEEQMGKKAPALVMVPAVDLPGKEVIHIACWLSQ
ncbi:diphthine--ammonia ligase isoform X2 [Varanus komodoensis]|uniref:diphthine--ammonia ligase isoform X2 n=1 Tax=Varanus komodoensis TaxID=61221 RepID=UPI001CF7BF40|nr:diphthine--ammonia ligase isoform X2 [Varanus komodoensis]